VGHKKGHKVHYIRAIGNSRVCKLRKGMAGTTRLELATSAVTEWEHQVLPTTYKAVWDCQVLGNTYKTNTFRVGHRVEKGVAEKDCRNRSLSGKFVGKNSGVESDREHKPIFLKLRVRS
jgi:hypothetical protein